MDFRLFHKLAYQQANSTIDKILHTRQVLCLFPLLANTNFTEKKRINIVNKYLCSRVANSQNQIS